MDFDSFGRPFSEPGYRSTVGVPIQRRNSPGPLDTVTLMVSVIGAVTGSVRRRINAILATRPFVAHAQFMSLSMQAPWRPWPLLAVSIVAILALVVSPASACAQASQVGSQMARGLREEGLVGAAWSTVGPAGNVSLGAAGLRQANRPEVLVASDRVQVGSVAKTVLATGILRLVTQRRLELDAPVAALLPGLRIENPWAERSPLLLRHLLDHTSGLDDARLWQLFSAKPKANTPLSDGFDPDRLRLVVRQQPGERFSYSNTGYTILALVIESITGERYETYLDAHLLRPLGMTNSTFEFTTQLGPRSDSSLAMGHFEEGALAPAIPTYLRPAMQFTTTVEDMSRLARFLMSDGRLEGNEFVDGKLIAAMGTPVGSEAARAGLQIGYGLGLSLRDRNGVLGKCHAGNTVGYRAMFCLYPEQQKAFFIAMNADNEDANYAKLDSLVIASLELSRGVPTATAGRSVDPKEWEGIYVLAPARFQMLAYLDMTIDFVRLESVGENVVLTTFLGKPTVLTPLGSSLFRAPGRIHASHVLLGADDGTPAMSDGLHTYERVSLWGLVPLWISLAAGLLGILYILVLGIFRLLQRRLVLSDPVAPALAAILGLLVGVLLLTQQPIMHLGDVTATNVMISVMTGGLAVAALVGAVRRIKMRGGMRGVGDTLALLAVLQWTLALAYWGLVPLRLWA